MNLFRHVFLSLISRVYEGFVRRLIFRTDAQAAHERLIRALSVIDRSSVLCAMLSGFRRLTLEGCEIHTGGATLAYPLMLAAGMVKGEGFASEAEAITAVERGQNIIPGWRSVSSLMGLVEFGSFTRYPRLGNPGTVMWRDERTHSTQNRVGLRNPGVAAAALFLKKHQRLLPPQFGINIALSPGIADLKRERDEIIEAVSAVLDEGVHPTWFTLNVSCPNTEDDPTGNQTEARTHQLCSAIVDCISNHRLPIPVWVKISPGLAAEQYRILMRVFHEVGVRAVIATNTLAQPTPDDAEVMGGVGGGMLYSKALEAVRILSEEKIHYGYDVDIIGCGGVLDGATYHDFLASGACAVQYWSALIYRGPLAAAIIHNELQLRSTTPHRKVRACEEQARR